MKMEEMIDICVLYAVKANVYKDEETTKAEMLKFFPTLKRWAK